MKNIPFIKYSKIWLVISGVFVALSLVFLMIWGLKPGIDFTGGSLMELRFTSGEQRLSSESVDEVMSGLGLQATVQKSEEKDLIIRTSFLDEDKHQEVLKGLKDKSGQEVLETRFETIGPAISKQLRERSLLAIIFVSLGIVLYVAYAFRQVSYPVVSWKYGLLAIVALIHDLMIVIGAFALLGHISGVEVNMPFVVALLTVLGYSVNDTIIVYDRIRENLMRKKNTDFSEIVNSGLNQTLWRSFNTSATTLLVLFALFFFGGATIHSFVLALIIGIISGTYSSIFIASPLLVLVNKWQKR